MEVVLVVHRASTVHPYLMITPHPRAVMTLGQPIVPLQVKRCLTLYMSTDIVGLGLRENPAFAYRADSEAHNWS
jgi:hypothetical protein